MAPADRDPEPDPAGDPETIAFKPVRRPQTRQRDGLRLAGFALVLLVGGAGAAWWFLDSTINSGPPEVPLIAAPASPVKIRPANPGGVEVPNQDKLVYDRIDSNQARADTERLLPPPKAPTPLPRAAAPAPPAPPAPPVLAPPVQAPPPGPAPGAAPAPPPAAAPAASASLGAGRFLVQLGAVRTADGANQEWERLSRRHADVLGGLQLTVVRADLGGDRGVFFRLRAGPIGEDGAARRLCETLTERKVACLVVRPGE